MLEPVISAGERIEFVTVCVQLVTDLNGCALFYVMPDKLTRRSISPERRSQRPITHLNSTPRLFLPAPPPRPTLTSPTRISTTRRPSPAPLQHLSVLIQVPFTPVSATQVRAKRAQSFVTTQSTAEAVEVLRDSKRTTVKAMSPI